MFGGRGLVLTDVISASSRTGMSPMILYILWLRLGGHSLYRTRSRTGECYEERARVGSVGPQVGMRLALSPVGAERGVKSMKQGAT